MLKHKHIAVVRAALRFMDEELTPHGTEALIGYLDQQDRDSGIGVEHIAEARDYFSEAELNYAMVDSTATVIESERLIPATSLNVGDFQSDLSILASVLISLP